MWPFIRRIDKLHHLSKSSVLHLHQNRTWMCLPHLENLTFSIPIFCPISHPSVYHFQKKSTQFWPNWMLFTIICPKYTLCNLGSFVSDEKPPSDRYTNFREKAPQKAGTYTYTKTMCENPSRSFTTSFSINLYHQKKYVSLSHNFMVFLLGK